MKYIKAFTLVLLVLIADQLLKVWVFNHMTMGYSGEINVLGFKWFKLHYTLNNGIAFGFLDGNGGYNPVMKTGLTIFRILAACLITYIIIVVTKKGSPIGFILGLSLILAGALGNIIDSIFYDVIFNTNYLNDDFANGIEVGKWFQGSVIDMLYFPMIDTTWPNWIPVIGGNHFQFFRPVFNLADSSITTGVLMILIFHRKTLKNL